MNKQFTEMEPEKLINIKKVLNLTGNQEGSDRKNEFPFHIHDTGKNFKA